MTCIICGEHSNYKCPTCLQPYCSVACCKQHKALPCTAPPKPQPTEPLETKDQYEFPTEDTVPLEKLKLLEKSEELKQCLANPHVREILKVLDSALRPDSLIQEYMQEPIFTEFVDACLKVVQPPGEAEVR
ncbi:zinc finger HIT domain-containing protein 3 [Choristoneura fumiferana]|uniref:zinc finger HIT domain-containing protein 3 n=1 Tax=Choristoneura fumiferana TaxID=7141 RepID=UPI003D15F059